MLRNACDQLLARLSGEDPAYLAGLLAGAARAVDRARQRQSLDVVWTGPETGIATGRLTAATVIDLIGQARREILLVSYATHSEPAIEAALAAAAARGVEITILAERHGRQSGLHGHRHTISRAACPPAALAGQPPSGWSCSPRQDHRRGRPDRPRRQCELHRPRHGVQPRMRHPHPRRPPAPRHPRPHRRATSPGLP